MYRIIYSLKFDLAPGPTGEHRQLIVPLQENGNAKHVAPVEHQKRVIDLRNGDEFTYRGQRERIMRISAYRDSVSAAPPSKPHGGYLYVLGRSRRD